MNNISWMICALTALVVPFLPTTAAADEPKQSRVSSSPQKQYSVRLGMGGLLKTKYPGSQDYIMSPYPIIIVDRLFVPGIGQVVDGSEKTRGFGIYPSFSFNGERKASDSANLTGTNSVDWAAEVGLGIRYRYDWLRGFVEVRQGFGGHNGQVATLGLDILTQPLDRTEIVFGPRIDWGSEDYVQTYFGVTAAEAAAPGSTLSAYRPSGGFTSVGADVTANYAYSDNTTLHLRVGWDRYIGDAANSPIVTGGEQNQFSIGAGFSYRFNFDLFN